jgi:hypothetical protein
MAKTKVSCRILPEDFASCHSVATTHNCAMARSIFVLCLELIHNKYIVSSPYVILLPLKVLSSSSHKTFKLPVVQPTDLEKQPRQSVLLVPAVSREILDGRLVNRVYPHCREPILVRNEILMAEERS